MLLIEDDRNKNGQHETKNLHWLNEGRRVYRARLPFGDYALVDESDLKQRGECRVDVHFPFGWRSFTPLIVVDTKRDIAELAMDLLNDHERFRAECVAAQESDCTLVILTENGEGVRNMDDLRGWVEQEFAYKRRNGKQRQTGERLCKIINTMNQRYGVLFAFCRPEDAGRRVIEILERGGEWLRRQN